MKTKNINDFHKVRVLITKNVEQKIRSKLNTEINKVQKIRLERIAESSLASIRETNLRVMNNFMVYVKYKEMFES